VRRQLSAEAPRYRWRADSCWQPSPPLRHSHRRRGRRPWRGIRAGRGRWPRRRGMRAPAAAATGFAASHGYGHQLSQAAAPPARNAGRRAVHRPFARLLQPHPHRPRLRQGGHHPHHRCRGQRHHHHPRIRRVRIGLALVPPLAAEDGHQVVPVGLEPPAASWTLATACSGAPRRARPCKRSSTWSTRRSCAGTATRTPPVPASRFRLRWSALEALPSAP
jgi:hypothetical protein